MCPHVNKVRNRVQDLCMSLMASVLLLGSAAVSHANADDDSRLIEVASRVEREWQGRNPEAKGLADRVRYLLKTPEPKADHELLSFVRLPSGRLDVMCGIDSACGFIFAHSDQGIDAEIQELEDSLSTAADPMAVRFRMATLAACPASVVPKDRVRKLQAAAVSLAREHCEKRPKDALAHAWLADCLSLEGAGSEKESLAEARRALELDPNCWRAMLVLAAYSAANARYCLRSGGAPAPGEEPPTFEVFMEELYRQPPDDQRIAAMERELAVARAHYDRAQAAAHGEPEPVERAFSLLVSSAQCRELASIASQVPSLSIDQMRGRVGILQNMAFSDEFLNAASDMLDTVARMRPEEPRYLTGWLVFELYFHAVAGKKRTPKETASAEDDVARVKARLGVLSRKADVRLAAKAYECLSVVDFLFETILAGKAVALDNPLLAIEKEPRRVLGWEVLMAGLVTREHFAAFNAATEIQRIIWPLPAWYRDRANAAAKTRDWKTCEHFTKRILEALPNDTQAKVEMVGVHLAAALDGKKVPQLAAEADTLREIYLAEGDRLRPEVLEALILNLVVHLCHQGDRIHAEEIIRQSTDLQRLPAETASKLLKFLARQQDDEAPRVTK